MPSPVHAPLHPPAPASLPSAEADLRLGFGAGGGAARHCRTGWSEPEADETWCIGPRSTLVLPLPALPRDDRRPLLLVLQLRPHVAPRLPAQRLTVRANGIEVGAFILTRRTVRACVIPAAALFGRIALEIVFDTPDAARPADVGGGTDTRPLAVAFIALRLYPDRFPADRVPRDDRPPPDIAVAPLMLQFESLGQSCEFGLVQRACAAEPLGLLRFASTPLPNLLAALDAGFAGMGTPGTVRVEMSANGREFMVKDTAYDLTYHAWVAAGEMTAEALQARELRRVPLLVRKLLEDLDAGEKIFVFRGMGALAEEAVFPLAAALRRYGPNTLLFVTLADAAHPAGRVERRAPGFLVGYLDRFAPGDNAHDFDLEPWVELCRAAWRLTRAVAPAAA